MAKINFMNKIDLLVQDFFVSSRTPELTNFLFVVTSFFDFSYYFIFLTILVTLFMYLTKGLRISFVFISTLVITTIIVFFLKMYFGVLRPENGMVSAIGGSFPSYHATMSTVFFVMIFYIYKNDLMYFYNKLLSIFSFSSVILVSFSRIYLGVHWLSDVVFGVILGVLIAYFSTRFFKINK